MGTVGLNFGSPTSGTGFDVSTTVAQIVSNLQNVETPWKTQLTTLQGQDTVISNLGTLFSTVSTDIGQLTDLEGTLAQKTGSSSDTNVLELTSASSSAAAGTHTVVVNSLAQTSSGYLAEIADDSDPLSGSVTLRMANGTAQTFNMSEVESSQGGATLSDLASAINASGVGITASVLTDATGSRLSLVSGTSGADGNIAISANSLTAAVSNTLSASVTAGTSSAASTAMLAAVVNSSESLASSSSNGLSDALSVTVGSSGSAQTIDLSDVKSAEGGTTLGDLATYIQSQYNAGTLGFTAQVVNNSDGTASLQLTSGTGGSTGTLSVTSNLVDSATALGYTSSATGSNASLTVDGVNLTSASNTVTNLIPGLTFQLLSTSPREAGGDAEQVQVVIANDNSGVETAVNQLVTDYNSLMSAMNTQEGKDSSGNPEPLFGSPTLSLLQQQLMNSINAQNPNGSLDPISSTAGTTLSGSITISLGDGAQETIQVGPGTSGNGVYYTGSGSDSNTLEGLAAAINAAVPNMPVSFSGAAGSDTGTMTVSDTSALTGAAPEMSGDLTIQVGSGTAQTVSMDDVESAEGGTTLANLASYITNNSSTLGVTATVADNGDGTSTLTLSSATLSGGALTVDSAVAIPGPGVTAAVETQNGQSVLTLVNAAGGSDGALSVNSSITASTPAALQYFDTQGYTDTTADSGTVGEAGANDTLIGSITFQAGTGTAATVTMDEVTAAEGGATVADLASYIQANYSSAVSAQPVNNSDGTVSLSLTSKTDGASGALTVTSNLYDSSSPTSAVLNYTSSSDVNSLTSLGIGLNNDGTMTFDASTLDSLLNSDFNGVVGFFQSTDSWGQSFATMLNNAGSSSSTGLLALAAQSNSNIESNLNTKVTNENSLISTQQTHLTTELNQANEILEELPSQLSGVNELYSAITGYNENTGG